MAGILEVATAEFASKGLSGARIDEIAAATRTSKRMIYYYFGSKEGLYIAVLEDAYRRMRSIEAELHLEDLAPEDDLAALDSDSALRRRLKHYAAPDLLLVDEVGYLSYSNRHADLLFELISRRYEHKRTVITTNRAFKEWHEVFPNAACVVSLIDRLVHRCEIVAIEGESYRLKEAKTRSEQKAAARAAVPRKGKKA